VSSIRSVQNGFKEDNWGNPVCTHVETGSNTSTMSLRVVGGNEEGSLKSETVKYRRESQGTRTRERLWWQGPPAYTKDTRPLVRESAPQKQDHNCQTVINIWSWAPGGAWHQDLLTYWPSVTMWLWLWIQLDEYWQFSWALQVRLRRDGAIVNSWKEFYTGSCDKKTWGWDVEETPLLEAVARERLLETLQTGEGLAWFVKCVDQR
jgi:hypothetical protein